MNKGAPTFVLLDESMTIEKILSRFDTMLILRHSCTERPQNDIDQYKRCVPYVELSVLRIQLLIRFDLQFTAFKLQTSLRQAN